MLLNNLSSVLQKNTKFSNSWLSLCYLSVILLLTTSFNSFGQLYDANGILIENPCNRNIRSINIGDAFVGGWNLIEGDTNVDTNGGNGFFPSETGGDIVPVIINSKLFQRDNMVVLSVTFHIREMGGDQTEYKSTKEFNVFDAGLENKNLISVRGIGGNIQNFNFNSYGKEHEFQTYEELGESNFWDKLEYRVDSKAKDDSAFIGIKGIVKFEVELTNNTSDELNECKKEVDKLKEEIAELENEKAMIHFAEMLKDNELLSNWIETKKQLKLQELIEKINNEGKPLKNCVDECFDRFGTRNNWAAFKECLTQTGCSDIGSRF